VYIARTTMELNTVGPKIDWSKEHVREQYEAMKNNIKSLKTNEFENFQELIEMHCGLSVDSSYQTINFDQFFGHLLNIFEVPKDGKVSATGLKALFEEPIVKNLELYARMNKEGLLEDAQSNIRTNNRLAYLYYVQKGLYALHRAFGIFHQAGSLVPADAENMPVVPGLSLFRVVDPEETNDYQKLLLYLLNCAHDEGYRKYNGDCYVQKYIDGDQYTHAWERKCSILEFIYQVTSKNFNFDMWKCMTCGKGNAASAAEYLGHCKDPEFPDLIKDRHVFSFRNGVYVAKNWNDATQRFQDVFWPYADKTRVLPQRVVACKYFEQDFDDYAGVQDWYEIPTPYLQSIVEFQDFSEEVARWMYVFIGRLIYEVGELDGWQVIPFLKGTAGSGKSTIALKVCGNIFEKSDVGILSNNIERKFGISAFADKYLFVAPEIKSDLQMEQAEFQSIVSGEDIQVNVKFAKAKALEWKVPGILAGNEVPQWADNSGSISRRAVIFDFGNQVVNGDMELARKLEREMPAILKKCNRAYLETAQKYGSKNIWNHLPAYFKGTRADLEEATNSMENFLNSDKVEFAEDAYCKYEEFVQLYRTHAKEFNLGRPRIDKDFLKTPFAKRRLHVRNDTRGNYSGRFIDGIRIVHRNGEFAEDF
jgi:hypothetical protein